MDRNMISWRKINEPSLKKKGKYEMNLKNKKNNYAVKLLKKVVFDKNQGSPIHCTDPYLNLGTLCPSYVIHLSFSANVWYYNLAIVHKDQRKSVLTFSSSVLYVCVIKTLFSPQFSLTLLTSTYAISFIRSFTSQTICCLLFAKKRAIKTFFTFFSSLSPPSFSLVLVISSRPFRTYKMEEKSQRNIVSLTFNGFVLFFPLLWFLNTWLFFLLR
ncbi:hypothetical protein CAEBREN_28660 [Caenorhabditis brenneri]|uniref:Uncharacterized protein n=1 Tax=Caenorhabditis brenneri TaxID=135651 RepID=G0M6Q8_CAEBE|nr:hypothetical protein CAEBREN_28660 [Caenorhabditis brenneri]